MGRYRTVDVHVQPDASSANGYHFWMEENGAEEDKIFFCKDRDGMMRKEHYQVDFKLHNEKGARLRFSEKLDQVLWAKIVNPGDKCPDSPCYLPGVFYVAKQSDIKPLKLTVVNTDMDVLNFAFAFNFVEKGQSEGPMTDYICFDPIGENRNGGVNRSPILNLVVLTVATVGVAALAFFAFRSWSTRAE